MPVACSKKSVLSRIVNSIPRGCGSSGAPAENCTSNDPNIVWNCDPPIVTNVIETTFDAASNLYFYEGANGKTEAPFHSSAGYYVDGGDTIQFADVIHDDVTPFGTGEYIVKYEVVSVNSGSGVINVNYSPGTENQWYELFRCDIRLTDETQDDVPEEQVVKVTVATNNGAGAPVEGSEAWKLVTFHADYRTA